jgi:EAL domain-containing protein (putative c-di-GMP-specific phosphodiesterase class I)
LNLETVAVYVETKAIAEYLRGVGITYAQGHYYGFDEPLADILASLCGACSSRERGARARSGL